MSDDEEQDVGRSSWWAALTGAADRELVGRLTRQLEIARACARIAAALVAGDVDGTTARRQATETEHRGDELRAEVVEELARLLSTPMDREDVHRLSRSLEDVLDNLRDFVREAALLGVGRDALLAPMVAAIVAALDALAQPVADVAHDLGRTRAGALAAQRDINGVRRAYQHGLAELYAQPLTIDTLKRRDLLRRLDVVGLRLGEAGAALGDGAMKRGH